MNNPVYKIGRFAPQCCKVSIRFQIILKNLVQKITSGAPRPTLQANEAVNKIFCNVIPMANGVTHNQQLQNQRHQVIFWPALLSKK